MIILFLVIWSMLMCYCCYKLFLNKSSRKDLKDVSILENMIPNGMNTAVACVFVFISFVVTVFEFCGYIISNYIIFNNQYPIIIIIGFLFFLINIYSGRKSIYIVHHIKNRDKLLETFTKYTGKVAKNTLSIIMVYIDCFISVYTLIQSLK